MKLLGSGLGMFQEGIAYYPPAFQNYSERFLQTPLKEDLDYSKDVYPTPQFFVECEKYTEEERKPAPLAWSAVGTVPRGMLSPSAGCHHDILTSSELPKQETTSNTTHSAVSDSDDTSLEPKNP